MRGGDGRPTSRTLGAGGVTTGPEDRAGDGTGVVDAAPVVVVVVLTGGTPLDRMTVTWFCVADRGANGERDRGKDNVTFSLYFRVGRGWRVL